MNGVLGAVGHGGPGAGTAHPEGYGPPHGPRPPRVSSPADPLVPSVSCHSLPPSPSSCRPLSSGAPPLLPVEVAACVARIGAGEPRRGQCTPSGARSPPQVWEYMADPILRPMEKALIKKGEAHPTGYLPSNYCLWQRLRGW